MAWFHKKADPISNRARALNDEIAHLESEIKRLDAQLKHSPAPRLRPGAPSSSASARATAGPAASKPARPAHEPVFEPVDQGRLTADGEPQTTPDHYNDLGIRKYDLPAFWHRLCNHFRGPSTTNPKLVSYLAAGGIQGLRPLRYEKRVARNRVLLFAAILFFVVLGLFAAFIKSHR